MGEHTVGRRTFMGGAFGAMAAGLLPKALGPRPGYDWIPTVRENGWVHASDHIAADALAVTVGEDGVLREVEDCTAVNTHTGEAVVMGYLHGKLLVPIPEDGYRVSYVRFLRPGERRPAERVRFDVELGALVPVPLTAPR